MQHNVYKYSSIENKQIQNMKQKTRLAKKKQHEPSVQH